MAGLTGELAGVAERRKTGLSDACLKWEIVSNAAMRLTMVLMFVCQRETLALG